MIVRRLVHSALLSLVCALSACAPSTEESTEPSAPLEQSAAGATETSMHDLSISLPAHHWRLTAATDAQGETLAALFPGADRLMGLSFTEGRINVEGGCNRMSGPYELTGDQIEIGRMSSTMMACPPPLEASDKAMSDALVGKLTAGIEGDATAPVLRLVSANGATLMLQGAPTPETRFGGPGERIFLEVAAERGACGEGATRNRTCPQVRERRYDDAGLIVGEPGPWRPLTTEIEGYTPTEGERQVLRLKRFERAGATGGEPDEHLVLDMIVEREQVR